MWSPVLRHKCCEGCCDLDIFKNKNGESNAWRGIVENVDILRQGVGMVVGNGNHTLFRHHKWTGKHTLLEKSLSEPALEIR